ncbi:MAG: 4'-phosphopantetheinyl transferase superfamily protein [Firmicutes bacterium]|nr:4'-phosphopantetheinyl transferase superfamily protein [Bacillota bacterium]
MKNTLYVLNTEELKDKYIYEYWYDKMPLYRREKTDFFMFEKDKRLSLAAGILLKKALDEHNVEDRDILCGKNGKPYLKDKKLHFNISHSENMAVCAVSDRVVGVDTEKVHIFEEGLINFVFHKEEIDCIRKNYADPDEGFTFLWTVKESAMKYFGTGLALEPKGISVDMAGRVRAYCEGYNSDALYFTRYNIEGYVLTVCSEYEMFTEDHKQVRLS